MNRERVEHALPVRGRQQAAIAQLGRIALTFPTLDMALRAATTLVAETLEVQFCALWQLVAGGTALRLTAGVGWKPGMVGTALVESGARSQAGFTLAAVTPVVVLDFGSETRFEAPLVLLEHSVVSSVTVAISHSQGAWGVLAACTPVPRRFSTADGHFLQAIATVLGAAVEHKACEHQRTPEHAAPHWSAERAELRRGFVTAVAHEFRTPLTALHGGLGMLEAAAAPRLQPAEAELLKSARRSVDRLGRLVDDLLVLNQLASGTLQVTLAPVDLRLIVAQVLERMGPPMAEHARVVEVNLPAPLVAWADAHWIAQAVAQLIQHTYEHSSRGTHIAVMGQATAETIELTIADTGPGEPQADRDTLGQRQGWPGAAEDGADVGLHIAYSIVELLQGQIRADYRAGGGLRMLISLPAVEAETRH